ncbi:MAG: cation transporter [Dehalococcoidia bacterium]|nr:MAG: cation transporter [Dehalococcoidia bacterium]
MNQVSQIIRVTIWGLCLNLFLVGLKLAVGIVVGSAALVADAVHSISDLFTDIVVILGIRLSSRPADEDHAYGHGRFETIATSLIGAMLVGAGVFIAWKSGFSLYRGEINIPGYAVVVVAAVSILSKEWIYRVTQRVARRVGSSALHVNAWHHRTDALSSVAVLFGAVAGLLGWGYGDQSAAIVVGVMVSIVGLNALSKVFVELTEGSISGEEQRSIAEAIQGVPGVKGWHRLRTRLVGREVFMDVHLLVDSRLSVAEGHRICSTVESAIMQTVQRPINIVVHCEPERDPDATDQKRSSQQ